MTDRMPDEQIAELAETPDYWLDFRTAQIRSALRQTSADLAQANATIAERDAEIVRLRALLADWRGKLSGPGVDMQTLLHRTDEALKETEHD